MRDLATKLSTLVESRPIRIDKGEARNVAKKLRAALKKHLKSVRDGSQELGELKLIGPVLTTDIVDVLGREQRINVAMMSKLVDTPGWIAGGGIGVHQGPGKLKGQPVIVVVLNGTQTVDSFLSVVNGCLKRRLYSMLIHELTHAADTANPKWSVPDERGRGFRPPGRDEYDRYFNDPTEVRAYMQEVVDQAVEFASSNMDKLKTIASPNKIVRWSISHGETWKEIEDQLNAKNRKLIMKAVYTAFRDRGLV